MIAKLIAAAMLVAAPVTASAPQMMAFVQYPLVHQVVCAEGKGTAFRVGGRHWLSVAHVIGMHGCSIDGQPVMVTELDGLHDFAQVDTLTEGNGIKINCDGFKPGEWYWASGFAYGAPFQMNVALYATYLRDGTGKRLLIGPNTVIPGMSGGVVMNAAGEAVGTVNAYVKGSEMSFSRDLRDTSVCKP